MKFKIDKIRVINFSTKMFIINNNYTVYDECIHRTQFVKDLEAFLVPKMFSCINIRTSFLSQLLGQIHN